MLVTVAANYYILVSVASLRCTVGPYVLIVLLHFVDSLREHVVSDSCGNAFSYLVSRGTCAIRMRTS